MNITRPVFVEKKKEKKPFDNLPVNNFKLKSATGRTNETILSLNAINENMNSITLKMIHSDAKKGEKFHAGKSKMPCKIRLKEIFGHEFSGSPRSQESFTAVSTPCLLIIRIARTRATTETRER